MILGLDQGYRKYKTSRGIIFSATSKRGYDKTINDALFIEIDGQEYTIGETGEFTLDINKTDAQLQKILTLAAIGASSSEFVTDVKIVAGLPVALYSKQAAALERSILDIGNQEIRIKGEKKLIRIKGVKAFPQAAALIYTDKEKYKNVDTITFDWGGYSVDVCYFQGLKLVHYNSYFMGCIPLFIKLAKMINSSYDLNIGPLQVERILEKGLKIDGVKQDLKEVYEEIESHISEVMATAKSEFNFKTADFIPAFGGGCITFKDSLKQHIKNLDLQPKAQFTNAEAFEWIGKEMLWPGSAR